MTTQERNAAMVNLLRADLQARYEPQKALYSIMSLMLALPGLRGFWPMSSFDENGDAFDMSEQDRTLTYNGNPTYNYDDLAPYIDLDGTGDYLSRADEAGLDILGTETYIANPGLTMGGWFWFDSLANATGVIGKWNDNAVSQRSYLVQQFTTPSIRFFVSSTGADAFSVVSTVTPTTSAWYFVVALYIPSTQLSVFVNGTETQNTTSIPAALFNSTADFRIGDYSSTVTRTMTGRASLCFLCASALSDAIIGNLFQQSRALFGV